MISRCVDDFKSYFFAILSGGCEATAVNVCFGVAFELLLSPEGFDKACLTDFGIAHDNAFEGLNTWYFLTFEHF